MATNIIGDTEWNGLPMPRRLGAIVAVAFGVSLSVIDSVIANVALPTLASEFGTSSANSVWIVNAYQLALITTLLIFSNLGDILGYRRIYISGLVLFTVASAGCALSTTFASLIAWRAVQGIGAAAITNGCGRFVGGGTVGGGGHIVRDDMALALCRKSSGRSYRVYAQLAFPASESRQGRRPAV